MSSFNSRSHGLARARHGVRTVLEMLRTLAGSVTGNRPHGAPQGNAFEKAVRSPEDMLGELKRQAMTLTPLVKRLLFDGFDGVPETLRLGWAQLPGNGSRSFSLGVFVGRDRFCQIALADAQGRVFVGDDPGSCSAGRRKWRCRLFRGVAGTGGTVGRSAAASWGVTRTGG